MALHWGAMFLSLLSCWQPEPFPAPEPAQVEAGDEVEGIEEEGEPLAEEEEEEPPAPAVAEEVSPWAGYTLGTPLTLVADNGSVIRVLAQEHMAVTVLREGPDRVKVRCDACTPIVEGWLQRHAVIQ